MEPDSGQVVSRKRLRVSYLPQQESFPEGDSVEQIVSRAVVSAQFEEYQAAASIDSTMSSIGFTNRQAKAESLSGGWRKRLALACALVTQPELLLLDEPTNHLDLEGVMWLESLLKSANCSFMLVSHDRAFLEGVTNRIVELNPMYPQGFLSVNGNYSQFLMSKEEQIGAQANLQQSLASKVRREIAWLQRGARARQSKSSARIEEAGKLIEQLSDVRQRNKLGSPIDIEFDSSGRKTKELMSVNSIKKSFGDTLLFDDLSFILSRGSKLGIVGGNGSGKTTLLKIMVGQLEPDSGLVKRADELKIVWFDQNRQQLDQSKSLRDLLSPTGDAVIFRGRSMHVTTWAKKFLFRPDQLNMPISYLSGGEQARILIANLMLQSTDVLILDEPTNDLDISSIEVLEESLEDFPGAVILVTHDRMMLDTVCSEILGLNGSGGAKLFADYEQCQRVFGKKQALAADKTQKAKKQATGSSKGSEKLTTAQMRELAALPEQIENQEACLKSLQSSMQNPDNASNYAKLEELMQQHENIQHELNKLLGRWEELETKSKGN